MEPRLGIYIHIPFCASKCGYCDFYSCAGAADRMADYQHALLEHIEESAGRIAPAYIDTVYFGGGTPSFYGAARLIELLDAVKATGRLLKRAEVTVEVNPDSVRLHDLRALRKAGFNRLSIGMQSANNDILKMIGRRHSYRQVEMAVENARTAGFDNISLDLIYGLPSQTRSDWADTLAKALALRPEHISGYGLKLEEGTPMYELKDSPLIPSDDEQADMYLCMVDELRRYGYEQYEISNFSIPGYESRHNLKYWQLDDYMGFGPGAHSCIGRTRYSYVRDLDRYIAGVLHGEDMIDEYETIGDFERAAEYLMLGMRTVHGVSRAEYARLYRSDFSGIAQQLETFVRSGWAVADGERWHFTPAGFLISNVLIGKLLEAQTERKAEHNPWMKPQIERQPRTKLPPSEAEAFRNTYLNNPILTGKDRDSSKLNSTATLPSAARPLAARRRISQRRSARHTAAAPTVPHRARRLPAAPPHRNRRRPSARPCPGRSSRRAAARPTPGRSRRPKRKNRAAAAAGSPCASCSSCWPSSWRRVPSAWCSWRKRAPFSRTSLSAARTSAA